MRWVVLLAAFATPAAAEIRPVQRPATAVAILSEDGRVQVAGATSPDGSVRPMRRVEEASKAERAVARILSSPVPQVDVDGNLRRSERPVSRPREIVLAALQTAKPPAPAEPAPRATSATGGLCGRASIRGETIAPVVEPGGCGIPDAVRVRQVSGLNLSRPARVDCGTATALDDWVRSGVIPTVGRRGGGPVSLQVAGSYSCRTRNHQAGAKMSEHSLGHAIDISAINLADGGALTVASDWNRGTEGRMLKALWKAACGTFGTVLGPDSDAYHRDHLHLDTARYRSGSYCR